ncbi:MAG TPA: hypothetical protein VFF50_02795, partial [Candidatus Deferrimicrobiaceae bacterium]|nr:hypothetical protein [Candidatus Deferrimicrobiaceae bacterium]
MSSPENPQFDRNPPNGEAQLSAPLVTYSPPPPERPPKVPAPKAGENPVWSGWDVLIIAVLTLGILFTVQLVTVVVAHHFAYPHRSWIEVAQKPVLALLAEFVAYVVVALYMILLLEGKYHTSF